VQDLPVRIQGKNEGSALESGKLEE